MSIADAVGGAARSAYKIHAGLRDLGITSRMLVAYKFTDDPDVHAFRHLGWRILDRPFRALTATTGLQYLAVPSSLRLLKDPLVRGADVVQIYNLHGGYASHLVLPLLSRTRTVVWRLSDMWPFTGHCAFSYGCERWRTGCGACPDLDIYPAIPRDRTAQNWRIKQWLYGRSRIHLVAPSHWIGRLASESPLLHQFPVTWIPNGVDLRVFKPMARADARRALGLPLEARIILFSGTEARKGAGPLAAALEDLHATVPGLFVVTIGRDSSGLTERLPARHLGQLTNDVTMSLVYAAADAFALPALADNLPNTALESLACGTPVVAFGVGGIPEAVRHMDTGLVARPGDTHDLAAGLRAVLCDDALRERLSQRAREVAEQDYSVALQAERFARLYSSLARTST